MNDDIFNPFESEDISPPFSDPWQAKRRLAQALRELTDVLVTSTPSIEDMNEIAERLELSRLDFIKMDIDGHEPFFFEGGWQTLERFRPRILMEVSAPYFLNTGLPPADIYDSPTDPGLYIYSEKHLE